MTAAIELTKALTLLLIFTFPVLCSVVQRGLFAVLPERSFHTLGPGIAYAQETTPTMQIQMQTILTTIPLRFEANQGQTDKEVKFLARGDGYTVFLTANEAIMVFPQQRQNTDAQRYASARNPHRDLDGSISVRMTLLGANPTARVIGLEALPGTSNYFRGNVPGLWQAGIPHYAKVQYENVYPGVDLLFYGNPRYLEYDFVVAPGRNPTVIKLGFETLGVPSQRTPFRIDGNGDLVLHAAAQEIRFHRPRIYQNIDGRKQPCSGKYVLLTPESQGVQASVQKVGFHVSAYDRTRSLIIDPELSFSTSLGGREHDTGNQIAVDRTGNVYMIGTTNSADFPTTTRAMQPNKAPEHIPLADTFVAKLDPEKSTLLYSTYLGGDRQDEGLGIAVDAAGNAYVTGLTSSTDFPLVNPLRMGADIVHCPQFPCQNAFVAKLNPTGDQLLYSTYLGGNGQDTGMSIVVDAAGSAYVTGETASADFPTARPLQTTLRGIEDVFVTKLNPEGNGLVYSTYLGGDTGTEQGYAIAVDPAGSAYVTGFTSAPRCGVALSHSSNLSSPCGKLPDTPNFPLVNPLQGSFGGDTDAFVAKLSPAGSALVYSTYLGSSKLDHGNDITVDAAGNAYIVGHTLSPRFPMVNTLQVGRAECESMQDIQFNTFVMKLNPMGTKLLYSACLGNSIGTGIALQANGSATVAGYTRSLKFPLVMPLQATFGGGEFDLFVTTLSPEGSGLTFSTYLGGSTSEHTPSIAVDAVGNISITGTTDSADFPTNEPLQPFNRTRPGPYFDAFVAKIMPKRGVQ